MSNKTLYIIIAVLAIVFIGGGLFLFLRNNSASKPASFEESPTTTLFQSESLEGENVLSLSEQPNQGKFNEYFTAIYLAKLPAGAEFDPTKIIKTKAFTSGEQFCVNFDMKKQIPANTLSNAVYDVNAKQDIQPRMGAFPKALGPGNSIGCEPLAQPTGKYEYKIYINNVLVSVLPFEIK